MGFIWKSILEAWARLRRAPYITHYGHRLGELELFEMSGKTWLSGVGYGIAEGDMIVAEKGRWWVCSIHYNRPDESDVRGSWRARVEPA